MHNTKNKISATDLKRNTADILNRVLYTKKPVLIERYGKVIAKIIPSKEEKNASYISEKIEKYKGSIKGIEKDTKKARKKLNKEFSKRAINE